MNDDEVKYLRHENTGIKPVEQINAIALRAREQFDADPDEWLRFYRAWDRQQICMNRFNRRRRNERR